MVVRNALQMNGDKINSVNWGETVLSYNKEKRIIMDRVNCWQIAAL